MLTLFLEQLVFQKAMAFLADTLERLDLTRKMKNYFCFNLKIYCIQVTLYEQYYCGLVSLQYVT